MKVCFFSRSAYPLFNPACSAVFGGAEVDLYLIARELAKDETYDVSFVVGDFGQAPEERWEGVRVVKSYRFDQQKVFQMATLVRTLAGQRTDVYVQEAASGGTGVIAGMCRAMGRGFVYRTASDIEVDGTFVAKNRLEGRLFEYGLRHATVVAQNEAHQTQLRERYGVGSTVIRNATSIPHLESVERRNVLWVGRSETLKQPDVFLDLVARFPDRRFVMICPPANFHSVDRDALKARAGRLPNLQLFDSVPFSIIDAYFRHAYAFVNTSIYEGFPNTFVQAMKFGVPIHSLNVNPDSFLTREGCGACAEGDVHRLGDGLAQLFDEPAVWSSQSERAYATALANHDMRTAIEAYKQVFHQALRR